MEPRKRFLVAVFAGFQDIITGTSRGVTKIPWGVTNTISGALGLAIFCWVVAPQEVAYSGPGSGIKSLIPGGFRKMFAGTSRGATRTRRGVTTPFWVVLGVATRKLAVAPREAASLGVRQQVLLAVFAGFPANVCGHRPRCHKNVVWRYHLFLGWSRRNNPRFGCGTPTGALF